MPPPPWLTDVVLGVVPIQAVPLISVPPAILSHLSAHEHHGQACRTHIGSIPQPCGCKGVWICAATTELIHGIPAAQQHRAEGATAWVGLFGSIFTSLQHTTQCCLHSDGEQQRGDGELACGWKRLMGIAG